MLASAVYSCQSPELTLFNGRDVFNPILMEACFSYEPGRRRLVTTQQSDVNHLLVRITGQTPDDLSADYNDMIDCELTWTPVGEEVQLHLPC